jgi:hypothetical protein
VLEPIEVVTGLVEDRLGVDFTPTLLEVLDVLSVLAEEDVVLVPAVVLELLAVLDVLEEDEEDEEDEEACTTESLKVPELTSLLTSPE